MTGRPEIAPAARAAFLAVQARARAEHGGNTGPLLTVYAVESFLHRLATTSYAQQMVLKGGMLMTAERIRSMTKDADLSTRGISNDEERVREVVRTIAGVQPDPHDGVIIDLDGIRTTTMREDAEYHGVRAKLVAELGRAKIPFALDFSFGDPGPTIVIELASVVDRPPVRLNAYPLTLNLAEKIVTAMQRRETSTRDRDFADLWVTSRLQTLKAAELRGHVDAVAGHRDQLIVSFAEALARMPDRQTAYAAMVERWRTRSHRPSGSPS